MSGEYEIFSYDCTFLSGSRVLPFLDAPSTISYMPLNELEIGLYSQSRKSFRNKEQISGLTRHKKVVRGDERLKIRNERLVRPDLSLAIWISNRMIVYQKSRPHLHSLSASPFYSFILHPSSILLSYHRNFVFCTPFFATNSTL